MKALALLACALLFSTPAFAGPPSKESVERLLKAANTEQLLVNMQKQVDTAMRNAMTQAIQQQGAGEDAQQFADAFSKKMSAMMKEELSWEKMRDVYIQVYAETFSQEEVNGLTSFYESPTGQAFIEKMPTVMAKSQALMQVKMAPALQKLQQGLQEMLQDAAKKKGQ